MLSLSKLEEIHVLAEMYSVEDKSFLGWPKLIGRESGSPAARDNAKSPIVHRKEFL